MLRRTAPRTLLAVVVVAALATTLPAAGAKHPASPGNTYRTYTPPPGLATDAGEPSIGVDWKTGAVFLQAGLQTAKVAFSADGAATWSNSSAFETSLISLDPIGFSDAPTGRMFVSQLTAVGSALAYTDDDGKTWQPSEGSGLPAGADHQTVGGGPYPVESAMRPLTNYPHAVYYCSQDIATAFCARSDTGGATFGASVPIYSLADCGGLHGHVRVAPDGTVYVPNSDCGGHAAVAVSSDAGLTWAIRSVSASKGGDGDPSIAAGKDGTAYLSYEDKSGAMMVSVTRDRGLTWSTPRNVGTSLGLQNTIFAETIVGDSDRAAVAFLGTTTEGDAQNANFGKNDTKTAYSGAEWHLYLATTYDRGASWRLVDATPNDPVQRGRICMGGTGCDSSLNDRNLLDFMDIQVDRQGRVLVGWPDGCTGRCVTDRSVTANPHSAEGRVTRQTSGPGLYRTPPPLAG